MLIADEIWPKFLSEAIIYERNKEVYPSPSEGGKYQITSTKNEVIHIARVNVPRSGETIGIRKFRTAIERINNLGNVIAKTSIYEHVAEEITLVELLPFLDWDETGRKILVGALAPNGLDQIDVSEARNDNLNNRVQVSMTQRNGQKKFRHKLLSVYGGACVISGCSVEEVLHACHINPHSRSGINLSCNGIILRADLHDLFDQNLLAIDPQNFVVNVSRRLRDTDYYDYNNRFLVARNDGKTPSREALQERWKIFINY